MVRIVPEVLAAEAEAIEEPESGEVEELTVVAVVEILQEVVAIHTTIETLSNLKVLTCQLWAIQDLRQIRPIDSSTC